MQTSFTTLDRLDFISNIVPKYFIILPLIIFIRYGTRITDSNSVPLRENLMFAGESRMEKGFIDGLFDLLKKTG